MRQEPREPTIQGTTIPLAQFLYETKPATNALLAATRRKRYRMGLLERWKQQDRANQHNVQQVTQATFVEDRLNGSRGYLILRQTVPGSSIHFNHIVGDSSIFQNAEDKAVFGVNGHYHRGSIDGELCMSA